jgi:hypothetical protein
MLERITFRADADLIDAARERARDEGTTLNELFRQWLQDYVSRGQQPDRAMEVIRDLQQYVRTGGRKFTRDEMNERR